MHVVHVVCLLQVLRIMCLADNQMPCCIQAEFAMRQNLTDQIRPKEHNKNPITLLIKSLSGMRRWPSAAWASCVTPYGSKRICIYICSWDHNTYMSISAYTSIYMAIISDLLLLLLHISGARSHLERRKPAFWTSWTDVLVLDHKIF